MLIVVDKFDSKKAKINSGKKFYYVGILDTETKIITYQHREVLVGRVLRGGLDIKGVVIKPNCSVQIRIQDTFYTKQNSMHFLELTYPYKVDLHLLSHGHFRFVYKSKLFYHTITRFLKHLRPTTEREHYPYILPNTNNEDGRRHVYKHFALTTSTVQNFSMNDYIQEIVLLCNTYDIISLSSFPRYREDIDLSSMLIDRVVDYTSYLSEVVCSRIIMCPINLKNLVSLRFLLVNHTGLRVVDFSYSYNDLSFIYDSSLFVLTPNLPFENVVFVLPDAPKFIEVLKEQNSLKFAGFCDKFNKEHVIQNILSKTYLLGKKKGVFIIQKDKI